LNVELQESPNVYANREGGHRRSRDEHERVTVHSQRVDWPTESDVWPGQHGEPAADGAKDVVTKRDAGGAGQPTGRRSRRGLAYQHRVVREHFERA
jgi:hypothetical protein